MSMVSEENQEYWYQPEIQSLINGKSREHKARLAHTPPVCLSLKSALTRLEPADEFTFHLHQEALAQLPGIACNPVQRVVEDDGAQASEQCGRKRRIAIVFSGGPAPGGHNVIAGLFDAAMQRNPDNEVLGFLMGPEGIVEGLYQPLTREMVDQHRNMGGFSMIRTGRTKVDTREKMRLSRSTCKTLGIDALVIVGGDDSNTNAAFLAENLREEGIQVIGVPKTIDGDILVQDASGNSLCAVSFGFHTAALAFSRNIASLCTDAASDVKYWHICKVMGRVASHLALEVALQTHPTLTLIGEELADYVDDDRLKAARERGEQDYTAYGMTLRHLSRLICNAIVQRAAAGKNYGVLVIPEGLLEFINEIQVLIIKLSTLIADYNRTHDAGFHEVFSDLDAQTDYLRRMARESQERDQIFVWNQRDHDFFDDIPDFFKEGLLTERDSHGNFQFSQVETDKILMGLVKDYLSILKEKGLYKVGIDPQWYAGVLEREGLDPDGFASVLFRNADRKGEPLLFKESIISVKTLNHALVKEGLLSDGAAIPPAILKVYRKSEPDFRMQPHFYGYDGRGSDPTPFDCNYTYNLGRTVFALIAGGATGQMAVIRNLEKDVSEWEPMGVPLAALMHLEERKGKMALVMEKKLVDVQSPAFQVLKAMGAEWLAARAGEDPCRRPDSVWMTGAEDKPLTLLLNAMNTGSSRSPASENLL
ncbi:6-phosphofructokinase [Desulfobotulus sp. H1]|uniref:6-phosphofructokinase n=1 Tax=Desulfobotulus pelophilus TaxID=2823377 RepID=A0ABT3NAC5_9BACT|nr:6-phosphofructokinase [Desulfobotulus pelophilus]MCW7754417.1 6-phosphofructokinase [Desulfobotulus pelophilus]